MGFFNQKNDFATTEVSRKYGAFEIYRKCKCGEISVENGEEKERKQLTGGYTDEFEIKNGIVVVTADAKLGAKNGVEGAEIACKAMKMLVRNYESIYQNEDRLLKAILKENFSQQINNLWREMVLVYNEDKEFLKSEKSGKSIIGWLFGKKDKNENADKDTLPDVSDEDVLKDYATSLSFAVITENGYLFATLGYGSFVFYNQYENTKAFINAEKSSLLGESGDIKFTYETYARGDFESVLITSEKLGCIMTNVDSLVKYAKEIKNSYSRSRVSQDAFVFYEENGVKNDLSVACKEYGLFVALIKDSRFQLSEEKERQYREERLKKIKEEAEQERVLNIQKNLEIAKDKSVYETYETKSYDGFENIKVFMARRQGRSHVDSETPCQDYCLSEKVSRGIVLAVSDGVGSCPKSDLGSKFATEAVIQVAKRADTGCQSEEEFVERLLSVQFRRKVFDTWLDLVKKRIRNEKEGPITVPDVVEYAATLLFAVITNNYYVVGNIGDGQIVLFNETEGLKVRKHSPKESSKTKSLVNINGYAETFIVEKYKRSDFSSVMLSTDGMYDPLENGDEFYMYAKEAKKRYLEKDEPYQAFCYTVDGEEYKELYSSNTEDDCTVVLATDTSFLEEGKETRYNTVNERYQYTIVESIGDISIYASNGENEAYTTVAGDKKVTKPSIDGVKFFDILESYEKDGKYYNVYSYSEDMNINKLYQFGIIAEQSERDNPVASHKVLKIYEDLLELIQILDNNGYALNQEFAQNLILYNEKEGLVLYPEAVVEKEENKTYENVRILSLFESLYGKLVCGDDEYPFFQIDYTGVGAAKYLTKTISESIGVIRIINGNLYFENCGSDDWFDMEDNVIKKGQRIPLAEGELFKIKRTLKTDVYSFVEKENF